MELKTGYKQTEIGVIPSDWEVKTLGEIGNFKNGINKSAEDFGFGHPFANLMDVFGKTSIKSNKNFGLINSNEAERKLYNLLEGDVLFIRSSVKPSGVGLTSLIEKNFDETVFSGFIIRFRDNGYLTNGFKKHCFYEEKFRNNIIGSSTVSANTNINQDSLKKILLAYPPTLAEQTAIATALSDADGLITALEKLIAKKRNIKKGAMQQLLQPKEGWELKSLGEICISVSSGTSNTTSVKGNYPIYGSTGIIGISENYDYEGDKILIARVGANAGTVNKVIGKYCVSDNTLILNYNTKMINTNFLYFYLIMLKLNKLVFGSGQPLITGGQLKNLEIPFLELEEQTRIATILSDMDAELSALEQKLEKYKKIKLGMMQELLTGKTRLV
jgi:type I restriction enzyme S subunit